MNIFYLHSDYKQAAAYHCDKHVIGMIKETCQMLSTAHRVLDGPDYADRHSLCAIAHINHPSTKWVREATSHYRWAFNLFMALMKQQTKRYGTTHIYGELADALSIRPRNIKNKRFTPPPQCMPDEYKNEDTVLAYRTFYVKDKIRIARWDKLNNEPLWYSIGVETGEIM